MVAALYLALVISRIVPASFSTSSITPGIHWLQARDGDKVVMHEDNVNIGDGTTPTWTVTIAADPDEELIKRLNGAKYYFRSKRDADAQTEGLLEIRGSTLIWTTRFIWASPEIAKMMARRENGFNTPVGVWRQPPNEMQIVGRIARSHDEVQDITFTISEDGNSIVCVGVSQQTSVTFIYHRQ